MCYSDKLLIICFPSFLVRCITESSLSAIDPLSNEIRPQPLTLRTSNSSSRLTSPTPDSPRVGGGTMRTSTESDKLDAILNYDNNDDDFERQANSQVG